MSGLINLFKSLFSGIFGFIGGLFGGKKAIEGSAPKPKKGNGYFLELDDSKAAPAASAPASTEAAKPASAQPMTVSKETIADAATKAEAQPAKTSTRKEKLAALAADKPATATGEAKSAAPEAPATPVPTPTVTKAPVSDAAFATKYLIPANNGGRRRPGANMSSYLDMARKINTAS